VAEVDGGGGEPGLEDGDGAVAGHSGSGEDGQLCSFAGLVGLGAGDGEDQAVWVFGDLVDGEGGELGAAEGGDEADEEQDPLPEADQVRLGRPLGGLPGVGGRAAVDDVPQLGGMSGAAWSGGAPWVRRMPFPHGDDPGGGGGVGEVVHAVCEADPRQAAAHGADLGAAAGQERQVAADALGGRRHLGVAPWLVDQAHHSVQSDW